jgi:uncharacterized protein YjbJ (UPF0337 family)
MNTNMLKTNWLIAKGKLKQRFPALADEDIAYEEGRESEMFARLQERTGQTREQLEFFFEIECGCCEPSGGAGLASGRDARTASLGQPPPTKTDDAKLSGRPPKPPTNRPAPREQAPDSIAHEQERSTGMSGQSGGV